MQIKRCAVLTTVLILLNAAVAIGQSIRLPRPPQDLAGVQQRAGWLVEHYWDLTDLAEAAKQKQEFEQGFVNYISLFDLAENDSLCSAAVTDFVRAADSAAVLHDPVLSLAEKYLFNLDSPAADEEKFMLFVQAANDAQSLSKARKHELFYWESVIENNRVGSPIEDFVFETEKGRRIKFSSISGERTLIIFDPTCADCKELLDKMKTTTLESKVVVVAVNTDRASFRAFARNLPASWIKGYDYSGEINGGAFALRKLPEGYLVSPKGVVVKKHFSPIGPSIVRQAHHGANSGTE